MRSDRIEVGDFVSVNFYASGSVRGTVLSYPSTTGDSWVIKEPAGNIIYVQMFERMDLETKAT